jgi:hypothetical protein
VAPPVEQPTAAVFGSHVSLGGEFDLNLRESYTAGGLEGTVDNVPVGTITYDHLLTPNYGPSIRTRALAYSFSDDVPLARGLTIEHRREDYEADVGIFGRLQLPWGFELMGRPGVVVRMVRGSTTGGPTNGTLVDLPSDTYLSTGWLGLGASLGGGLGWRVFGPLSLAGTAQVDYLYGGNMDNPSIPSVLPMLGYRAGGELRLDFGPVGLAAGYAMGHWGHDATNPLYLDWGGPTARLLWIF